jgi:hypothetical protein
MQGVLDTSVDCRIAAEILPGLKHDWVVCLFVCFVLFCFACHIEILQTMTPLFVLFGIVGKPFSLGISFCIW